MKDERLSVLLEAWLQGCGDVYRYDLGAAPPSKEKKKIKKNTLVFRVHLQLVAY